MRGFKDLHVHIHLGLQIVPSNHSKGRSQTPEKTMGPLEAQGISGEEFRVGSRKGTWGLNEHSYVDPVDALSLEGTLSISKFRGQAGGLSYLGMKPAPCTAPTVGLALCNTVGVNCITETLKQRVHLTKLRTS